MSKNNSMEIDLTEEPSNRSFRVRPSAWIKADKRARAEGTRMSNVIGDFVEGYAVGYYNPPKRITTLNFDETALR